MKSWWMRWRGMAGLGALAAGLLWGCEATDRAVGMTEDRDYTLTLQVADNFVHVGDQTPVVLRLKRTDNSNLEKGMGGRIAITLSEHGRVDRTSVSVVVGNDTTKEMVETVIFTAVREGVAEVRASFLDATAQIKILISSVNP